VTGPLLPDWIPNRLLTADETAVVLNLSLRHVRRLIASGALPATRIGRSVRIRPEAIAALVRGDSTGQEMT
jgi:excisionase family DNA binding protein